MGRFPLRMNDTPSLFQFLHRHGRCARMSWRTGEPYWLAKHGPYHWAAGFHKGFMLGVHLALDEISFSLGLFSFGWVRDGA